MSHPFPFSSSSLFGGGGGVGLISSTLRSLVELAFGPSGSDAILQTSATSVGKVVITNSGESILKQTQVEHPIAKLIVDAVDQHGRVAGDGSVTVVLQLAASMEEALHFTQGQLGIGPNATSLSPSLLRQSHLRRHRLISSLKQIHRHWIVNGALERWLINEKSSPIPQNDDNTVRLAVTHIIRTMMGNKLSASAVSHLSAALVELIFQSRLTSATPLHTVCTDLLHDFAFVHCPGLPLTESKPLHGLVCPGRVAVRGMATELQATKVLILHGEFHSTPMKHEVAAGRMVFETASTEATMAFLTAGEQFIRRWVERLRRDGVALVLSSRTIHDATLGLLHEAGITAVHGMDEYDTCRIAKYTRTVPVSSLERFEDTPLPLGQLAAFTQIMVGGQVMLHVEMDIKSVVRSSSPMHVPDLIRGHTLLVCGASDGMCRQYANLLTRGLTLIREWSFGSIEYGRQLAHNGGIPDATSVSPLYVTGGGCSVELSLLMFLSDQARRGNASLTAPLHPLAPPSLTGGVIEPFAWRLLERSVESVIRSLLVNGHASGQSSSFSSSTLTRPTPMPWLKMLPHIRILHERSGLRNFGFNFNAIALNGNAQPFRPLFEMIRPSSSVRTLAALQELQLAVGTSELELLSLLPSLFTIGDTLTSASTPLFESPFTKVHVWATCLSLVLTLLRIDEMVVVKSVPSSSSSPSNSIAALNRTPGRSRDRKRIQPRRDWNDDDDDSEQENENGESSDDSDRDD